MCYWLHNRNNQSKLFYLKFGYPFFMYLLSVLFRTSIILGPFANYFYAEKRIYEFNWLFMLLIFIPYWLDSIIRICLFLIRRNTKPAFIIANDGFTYWNGYFDYFFRWEDILRFEAKNQKSNTSNIYFKYKLFLTKNFSKKVTWNLSPRRIFLKKMIREGVSINLKMYRDAEALNNHLQKQLIQSKNKIS